jgi:hypothetical protein
VTQIAKEAASQAAEDQSGAGRRCLRRSAAASHLQREYGLPITPRSLAKLAYTGGGPVFQLLGRYPVYTRENLNAWAESRLSGPLRSTSETGTRGKTAA